MQSDKKSSNGTEPVARFLRPRALGWGRLEACAVHVGLPERQEHSSEFWSTEHTDGLHNHRVVRIGPCRQLNVGRYECNGVLHDFVFLLSYDRLIYSIYQTMALDRQRNWH
jgi:hypothetical protein